MRFFTIYQGCNRYPLPVGRISGHFLESGSCSGSGQTSTRNRISQPDDDWSFLAVFFALESVTWITEHQARLLPDNAEKLIFMKHNANLMKSE